EPAVERGSAVLRIDVAQEVPRRVDEGVHRVRLAYALATAARAGDTQPLLVRRERRLAPRLVVLDLRQQQGKRVVRHGARPAVLAMDDGDRAAPVALAREAPVAQPVRDGGSAASERAQLLDDRRLGVG